MECDRSDIASKSGLEDEEMDDYNDASESDDTYSGFGEGSSREWWGARMTKAAMVPPLTRKYEVIEEYRFVEDVERVAAKMKVSYLQIHLHWNSWIWQLIRVEEGLNLD